MLIGLELKSWYSHYLATACIEWACRTYAPRIRCILRKYIPLSGIGEPTPFAALREQPLIT